MKLSVGGYSFYNTLQQGKMDVFGYLETVRYRYGLHTADLWNGQLCSWDSNGWKLPEAAVLQKIRVAIVERELEVVNLAIDSAHIWDPDPDRRDWLHRNALEHLRAAAVLGAGTVRIDTGGYDLDAFDDKAFEYVVKRYEDYCRIASDYGFLIGPENHMGPSLMPREMKRIAEAVNHSSFGILLHVNRWKEDKEIGDELVAPYVFHTHLDPSVVEAADAVRRINMLKSHGYNGYWGVEFNADHNQYTEVEWLLSSVKRLLGLSETVSEK